MKKMNYETVFAEDCFGEGGEEMAKIVRKVAGSESPRIVLVADMNVVQHNEGLGTKIGAWVKRNGIELVGNPVVLSGGEKIKSDEMHSAMKVSRALLDAKLGGGSAVIALGGGTLLDVVGWSASQIRGRAKVIRIPTTPAAMFDSAFSGRSYLNATGLKDAFIADSEPAAVVIDTLFAKSVLDGVWRAGFSEVVRHAVVSDAALMKKAVDWAKPYRERDYEICREAVKATVTSLIKKGESMFGMWSVPRLEAMSSFKLPHGYAVALGIVIDSTYAVVRGILKEEDRRTICASLIDCGAMEGAMHSRHLLSQTDALLRGLDAYALTHGREEIALPVGLGKKCVMEKPDREIMVQAIDQIK